MPAQVAIIHGWSDTSSSFERLKDYLRANGFPTVQIWLGDYISMDDDVRVEDVAKRMEVVIRELIASGRLIEPFDLIVHSTGGLVAREWIATFYPSGVGCPAKRMIMLAPANFGSRLAALGKSMIGRLSKGWKNWFQTGEQMLRALELASPYQWDLARRDLVNPGSGTADGPYGHGKVWPFVIIGTEGYDKGLREIVNEDGSDGTVRVPAANLNIVGMTLDFTGNGLNPSATLWNSRVGVEIPFAVLPDRDHGSIINPGAGSADLGQYILQALACDSDAIYDQISQDWLQRTEQTAAGGKTGPDGERFHQYMQFVVRCRDDHGQPVDDFFLEFFSPTSKGSADAVFFHREVLEHVHTNSVRPNLRCLFIDRTDLVGSFYSSAKTPGGRRELAMSISAAALGPNVRYFDSTREGAKGEITLHAADEAQKAVLDARLHRNRTHLVEIVIPRQPIDKVYRMA